MAPVPLNISPTFRPWRQAGITHLLLDDDVRESLFTRPASVETVPDTPPPHQVPSPQNLRENTSRDRTAPTVPSPASPVRPTIPERPATAARPIGATSRGQAGHFTPTPPPERPAAVERPTTPVRPVACRKEPSPAQWPSYWQNLLQKTPRTPQLVWTYPSLSRDLGGDADAAHRDFLRRLLGDMALPKGTHAFWPLNSYPYGDGQSEETVEAELFMAGVAVLKPETVILMCGTMPSAFDLGTFPPLMPSIVQGRRFVVTPHVDALIREPHRYAQLIAFLKSLVSGR